MLSLILVFSVVLVLWLSYELLYLIPFPHQFGSYIWSEMDYLNSQNNLFSKRMLKMLFYICATYTTCVSDKCIYLISPFSLQIFCQSPDQPCSILIRTSKILRKLGVRKFSVWKCSYFVFSNTAYDIHYCNIYVIVDSIIDLCYLIHHHTRRSWKYW